MDRQEGEGGNKDPMKEMQGESMEKLDSFHDPLDFTSMKISAVKSLLKKVALMKYP